MNRAIARILKEQLIGTPVIDKFAGLVQTAEYPETDYGENGETPRTTIKRIPISIDAPDSACDDTTLVPDGTKSGILYFEDRGSGFLGTAGQYNRWNSRLRMVCWFNAKRVGYAADGGPVPPVDVAALLINHIVTKLHALNASNRGNFLRIVVGIEGIPRQNKSIFSDYTYDLHNTQYLLYPYEYFAIDLGVEFQMHPACIHNLQVLPESNCP